jgi:hypothetical protein
VLSAVGTDLKLSTLEGPSLPATLQTCSYSFGGMKRVRVRSTLPFFEGEDSENVTAKVSKKQRPGDSWNVSSSIPQQLSGRHRMNADGMFHRFEFSIPAAANWTHAHGWEPDFIPTTER